MQNIKVFESLGDNCEFGFVQRALGYEPGGLLRWAIAQPEALVKFIRLGCKELYKFENLSPSARDMVKDAGTGLFFHSRMISVDGVFVDNETTRKEIWEEESEKIDYLREKLLKQIQTGSKIFVYKTNGNVSESDAADLADALESSGPAKLLCVRQDDTRPVGEVYHHACNLYFGTIDRFAPYNRADDVSLEAWQTLLRNASALIPV